ncbi:hypothetical protein [Antrihabitans sp. YC2-6]|uniref:hypothetical protein n=1 Tax=Antrihabitans sp. YC2-6 TaxID=2799498 RepID=UPI0018F69D2E|nr:hypothetical protein [Antrihabitans sp. YC2-6]MBJ8345208.1 hypothetical protein [Antrihabitans sp. YC2-6]
MTTRIQILCASSGFVFVVALFGGLLTTGFFPLPSPDLPKEAVSALWQDNPNAIRLGLVIMMFGAALTAPLVAAISFQLKRIGRHTETLASVQLICGTAGVVAIFMPIMIMMAASYRPERDPDVLMLANDMAWIPFIINGPPAIFQCISIGIAILTDKGHAPIYPRWVGYLNLWIAFTFLPACLLLFFKTGPFAWNGLLSFWLAATTFGTWFLVMATMTIIAARREPEVSAEVVVGSKDFERA